MVNFLGLVLAIVVFALVGLYYVPNARQLSEMFVQSVLKMPRFLRFLFPIRWYQSESFVWTMGVGGYLPLVVSLALFVLLIASIINIATRTI
jgi:hypothetical protein